MSKLVQVATQVDEHGRTAVDFLRAMISIITGVMTVISIVISYLEKPRQEH